MGVSPITGVLLFAGLSGLVVAAATDFKDRIIHNEVVLYVACVGGLLRMVAAPWLMWVSVVLAAFLLVILGFVSHLNIIGGGDAKLIAATTLLAPLQQVAQLIADIAIAGGLLSCVYFLARFAFRKLVPEPIHTSKSRKGRTIKWRNGWLRAEANKIGAGEPMPYALAILGGAIYFIISGAG